MSLDLDLSTFTCLEDYVLGAKKILDEGSWSYFGGGAADEITLRANTMAWSQLKLRPRVLKKLAGGNTEVEILGKCMEHPIFLAPVAYQKIAHPSGELGSAYPAAVLGAGYILSAQSSTKMEDVADIVRSVPERGPLWFQIYWQGSRVAMLSLINRIESAGYEAIVLTLDAPVQGVRDRQRQTQFKIPADIRAVNLTDLPVPLPLKNNKQGKRENIFEKLMADAMNWDDVQWLIKHSTLPVILKGILHPDDAKLAQTFGAQGIIVSNHGGRNLDTAVTTCSVLPAIRKKVGSNYLILVDGGIRRGTDVLKAICLGANAVLIGQPYVMGLACAASQGVAHIIRLLQDELEIAMVLCGCHSLKQTPCDLIME